MEYEIYKQDNYSIIRLQGEVDLQYSPLARQHILSELKSQQHAIVDLSGVSYMDSSGIASLVEGLQYARINKLHFALIGLQHSVMQVLRLARLDQVFPIFDSIDACIKKTG